MSAIWTPSRELWTPARAGLAQRRAKRTILDFLRQAAGSISTCGSNGKINTANGKISTNANQTGGCECSTCTMTMVPPIICFCPGTAGTQTINVSGAPANAAWTVSSAACADISVSPASGTSSSTGTFSFAISYSGTVAETCTVSVSCGGQTCPEYIDVGVPTGCTGTSFNIGGGPITVAMGGAASGAYGQNPSGVYMAVATCGITCGGVVSPNSPSFDGTINCNSNINFCNCWAGYQVYPTATPGPQCPGAPVGAQCAFVELTFYSNPPPYYELTFSLVMSDCSELLINDPSYVKTCGSTPQGVYTATQAGVVPQTLYVY